MLTIGIWNNMPEAAIRSTERQFLDLLATTGRSIARTDGFLSTRQGYEPIEALWAGGHLDGLVVTGAGQTNNPGGFVLAHTHENGRMGVITHNLYDMVVLGGACSCISSEWDTATQIWFETLWLFKVSQWRTTT